jgi:hypothetical protein
VEGRPSRIARYSPIPLQLSRLLFFDTPCRSFVYGFLLTSSSEGGQETGRLLIYEGEQEDLRSR